MKFGLSVCSSVYLICVLVREMAEFRINTSLPGLVTNS